MHPSPAHLAAAAALLPPADCSWFNVLAADYARLGLVAPVDPSDLLGEYCVRRAVTGEAWIDHTVTLHAWCCTCWSNRTEGDCFHVRAALVYARAVMLALDEAVEVARVEEARARTDAATYAERAFSLESQLSALPA